MASLTSDERATALRQRVGPGLIEWATRPGVSSRNEADIRSAMMAMKIFATALLEGVPDTEFFEALGRGGARFDDAVKDPAFEPSSFEWDFS